MNDTGIDIASGEAAFTRGSIAGVSDFVALMKPRVMSLVVFTALVGLVLAPGEVHPVIAFAGLLAIAVGAGAAGALNMWYDADIDAAMQRTAKRPIPRGRIAPGEALGFGATLAGGAVLTLGLLVNWAAAALLALTIAFYLFVYTIWLKRRTPQNIVIGGAAGALPPVIGWAVVTGTVDAGALVLFAIIFLWTPSHFWALSLTRARDYANAGVPMLPVVAGPDETRRQILIYAAVLVPATLLPGPAGIAGPLYAAVAAVAGALYVLSAWRVYSLRRGQQAERAARALYGYSILYLFLLFAVMLGEHGAGVAGQAAWSLPWVR